MVFSLSFDNHFLFGMSNEFNIPLTSPHKQKQFSQSNNLSYTLPADAASSSSVTVIADSNSSEHMANLWIRRDSTAESRISSDCNTKIISIGDFDFKEANDHKKST